MEIRIADIPAEGLFFEVEDHRSYLEWIKERYPFQGPIRGWLKMQLIGIRLLVKGEIHACLLLPCSRCLEEFPYRVDVEFLDEYLPLEVLEREGEEVEVSQKKADLSFYGEVIDTETLYLEKIYLSLPMKPLCSQDCKGFCARCGINLNQQSCQCHWEEVDPRWEPLKALKDGLIKK